MKKKEKKKLSLHRSTNLYVSQSLTFINIYTSLKLIVSSFSRAHFF